LCPANTYSDIYTAKYWCRARPAGSHTKSNQHTSISQCMCRPNYTGADGTECNTFAAGKYKTETGSADCDSCGPATTSPIASESALACACIVGHTNVDGTGCTPCTAGKYQSAAGSDTCASCDANQTSPEGAATAMACMCLPGYTATNAAASNAAASLVACAHCAPGKHKTEPGTSSCDSCKTVKTSKAGSTSAEACVFVCPPGMLLNADDECQACPDAHWKVETDDRMTCYGANQCPGYNVNGASDAFQNDQDKTRCHVCKYTGGGGDSYCCLPAQYVYGFTGECKWCPLDTYNSVLSDMETCTACPHFSGNTGGNSDGVGASISTCRCKEGYTGAGGPAGTFHYRPDVQSRMR